MTTNNLDLGRGLGENWKKEVPREYNGARRWGGLMSGLPTLHFLLHWFS